MSSSHVGRPAVDRLDTDFAAESVRQIQAWCTHPALAELVEMFGGAIPPGLCLSDRLAFLDEFSGVWDYRGRARADSAGPLNSQDAAGAARWLIPRLSLPAAQLEKIEASVAALGLTGETTPEGTDFDHFLVIGGARYTNLLRARYAREMAIGRRVGHVVLAAASRRLLDSEEDAIDAYAPGARTEFELLAAAAADAFGLDTREVAEHARERVDQPQRGETVCRFSPDSNDLGAPITLLETPSPDPGPPPGQLRRLLHLRRPDGGHAPLGVSDGDRPTRGPLSALRGAAGSGAALRDTRGISKLRRRPIQQAHSDGPAASGQSAAGGPLRDPVSPSAGGTDHSVIVHGDDGG